MRGEFKFIAARPVKVQRRFLISPARRFINARKPFFAAQSNNLAGSAANGVTETELARPARRAYA
jgi:hypothetical protein